VQPAGGIPEMTVGVWSILIVIEAELDNPAPFVAEQVIITPSVSPETVAVEHPVDVAMPDSASVTDQDTVTGLVYQPLLPSVPAMLGVMTGGVVSVCTVVVASATVFAASTLPTMSRAML
jgi:hypothetical protein